MSAICKPTRKPVALFLCLALLAALSGCAPKAQRYSVTYLDVFDTVTTLTAYAPDRAAFDALSELLHTELLTCHQLFDIYHEVEGVANLCTVNRNAGIAPVEVDERILELLRFGLELGDRSGGKLNLCMGSVLSLWHDARTAAQRDPTSAALPDAAALQEAQAHCDPSVLLLNPERGTVFLTDPAASLDVGAIGKGWAAQRACELARAAGYSDFLLSAGGNVCAVGAKPGGEPWRVGMDDPAGDGELGVLSLSDCCAVTSGSYQRYFTVDDAAYHHIIDPDTAYPATGHVMVTVVCADSAIADALSTALFLLPQKEGQTLAEAYGAAAFWLDTEGKMAASAKFSAYCERKFAQPS